MQEVLAGSIELVTIGFIMLMVFDFLVGLKALIQVKKQQLQLETSPQEQATQDTITPKLQPKIATLSWVKAARLPEVEQSATPNIIELARVRQLRSAEEVKVMKELKTYKLHGQAVVRVSDLNIKLPSGLKTYLLHKQQVVRLSDLKAALTTLVA